MWYNLPRILFTILYLVLLNIVTKENTKALLVQGGRGWIEPVDNLKFLHRSRTIKYRCKDTKAHIKCILVKP